MHEERIRCPRCGGGMMGLAAGSRMIVERDVDICPVCGTLEAMRDAEGLPPVPFSEWPVDPHELGREFVLLKAFEQRSEITCHEVTPDVAMDMFDQDAAAREVREAKRAHEGEDELERDPRDNESEEGR